MSGVTTIAQLALGDLRERSRRYSLLVTIAATVWFGSICLPPRGARYSTIGFEDWRGIYNSAWVGGVFAILTSVMLSLPGFYLVKGAIARDRSTRVGEILAATPVGKPTYLFAKWLSNFAYLSFMSATLAIAALVMQLARGEDRSIDLWQLWSPFLWTVAPVMAVIGALAVLFESVRLLRGAFGNVVFYLLWNGFLGASIGLQFAAPAVGRVVDLFGSVMILESMAEAASPHFPEGNVLSHAHVGFYINTDPAKNVVAGTFLWHGVDWTTGMIALRLGWVLVAFGLTAFGALFFDRFDSDGGRGARVRAVKQRGRGDEVDARSIEEEDSAIEERGRSGGESTGRNAGALSEEVAAASRDLPNSGGTASTSVALSPLAVRPGAPRLAGIVSAELRLAIKGVSRWWYVVAIGLVVAGALVPAGPVRAMVLGVAWLWPLPLFSAMGCRERRYGVDEILAAAPHPLRVQLTGLWLAGVAVAIAAGSGVAIRLAVSGAHAGLGAWLVGALFIPSLALALGVWSSTPRLFEAIYLVLWYSGPMNQVPILDYGGFTSEGMALGMPRFFLAAAVMCLGAAFVGRMIQARSR